MILNFFHGIIIIYVILAHKMSARKILPYGRSHTSSSYVPSSMGYSGGYQSSYSSNYSPSPSSLYSSYALTGRSQASSYSRPTLPYARTWTGFNSVVAVHPSQLRRRRERRFHLDDIPEYVKPAVEVPRVRRMSSTTVVYFLFIRHFY